MVATFRSRSRRHGAVSLKKSLDQRRVVKRARFDREDNHAKSASARVLRGRSVGSTRANRARAARYGIGKL